MNPHQVLGSYRMAATRASSMKSASSINKIPFGLKDGILVEVSKVASGRGCGCVCPACHRRLQANKGKIKAHHFSHDPDEDSSTCELAFETAIHLMAKQILAEQRGANFPELTITVMQSDANGKVHEEQGLVEGKAFKSFDRVELEKRLDNIRPDIIAYEGDKPFLIEIAVTNASDRGKINLIRGKSLAAIEIDLSNVSYETTEAELKQLIVEQVSNKKWLSNPAVIEIKKQLQEKLAEKIRKIDEGIDQERKNRAAKNKVETERNTKSLMKHVPIVVRPRPVKPDKEYKQRWFICEACRFIFNVSMEDAPHTIESIICPDCGYSASAR